MRYTNVVDGYPFKSYVRDFARSAPAAPLPLQRGGTGGLLELPRKRRLGEFDRQQGLGLARQNLACAWIGGAVIPAKFQERTLPMLSLL